MRYTAQKTNQIASIYSDVVSDNSHTLEKSSARLKANATLAIVVPAVALVGSRI